MKLLRRFLIYTGFKVADGKTEHSDDEMSDTKATPFTVTQGYTAGSKIASQLQEVDLSIMHGH